MYVILKPRMVRTHVSGWLDLYVHSEHSTHSFVRYEHVIFPHWFSLSRALHGDRCFRVHKHHRLLYQIFNFLNYYMNNYIGCSCSMRFSHRKSKFSYWMYECEHDTWLFTCSAWICATSKTLTWDVIRDVGFKTKPREVCTRLQEV